ncbi:Flp family type IVb pilin [Phenylobacterium sp.]|uniref:Flp family type IVb pilin n=1 Tax=Phenylobacterium sp. TaxID=1871053 RepID=UPI002DEB6819|nr:Flp family type IVb pilin [Phenylobacterium sp.]
MLKAYVSTKTRLMDVRDRVAGLRRDESGAAMIEYALVVGLVAVLAVTALTAMQTQLSTAFSTITNKLSAIH